MLPQNTLYKRKNESAAGRRIRTSIMPQQGSGNYSAGNTIVLNIPTAPNSLLIPTESTFNFTVTATNASGNTMSYCRWDSGGAHSIIQRIRVYHGSNLLEDIDNYGLLAKLLMDWQAPQDTVSGRKSVTIGTRSDAYALPQIVVGDITGTDGATSKAQLVSAVNRLAPVRYSNSGALIGSAIANNASASKNYCINLISLVGSLSAGKYLPLFAMTSAPLRVELQLVSNIYAACAVDQSTGVTFQLSNCEFVGEFLQLSDSAVSMIMNAADSPLQFVCPGYSNYQYTAALGVSQTQVSIPVAAKFSSLKGLVTTIRDTSKGVGTATFFPHTSHAFSLNNVFYRIGAQVVPSKALQTTEEMFIETTKVFGSVADLMYQPAVDAETYNMAAPVAATNGEPDGTGAANANLGSGSFAVGMDLEVYAGASKDEFFQGLNTNTDDVFIVATHAGQGTAIASARYDTFAIFDRVVVFENGTAYIRF